MKCKYCGGILTLEDAQCPYCGKTNEQARQHTEAMKHYHGEFEHTKKKVRFIVGEYTQITVRFVILAILIIFVVAGLIVKGNAYSIRRAFIKQNAKQHVTEYTKLLERYLEEENYQAFLAFCNANYIASYEDSFQQFYPAKRAAQSYCNVYTSVMKAAFLTDFEMLEQTANRLSEDLDYFYDCLNWDNLKYYDNAKIEENVKAMNTMEHNVTLLLNTYCNLSDEQAKSISDLSSAKRAILIEEALTNGK